MKRIIVCIILTAVIFAGGTACLFYTANTSDKIAADLDKVTQMILSGDTKGASTAAAKARKDWQDFKRLHILSVDNDHVLEITMSIARIESLLERQDEEAVTECAVAKELLRSYKNENMPNIRNIL